MKNTIICFLVGLALYSCGSGDQPAVGQPSPKKIRQWINPLFFNEDFDNELSFPLWFDDSLIRANGISKITRRIYPRIVGDTSEINRQEEAMPREKREYYFDANGLVDRLVVYYYFDDREIARASFMYLGNMDNNGYRQVAPITFRYLSEDGNTMEFNTQTDEREYNFILHYYLRSQKKYIVYQDAETEDHLFFLRNQRDSGALSVDSILRPAPSDWIVCGTSRKPYKRYKVENKLTESQVHRYAYWPSSVLKERTIEDYPFENKRSFLYDRNGRWVAYTDSTFSEGLFITRTENIFTFDPDGKPLEVKHRKENSEKGGFFYLETLRYRYRDKPSVTRKR